MTAAGSTIDAWLEQRRAKGRLYCAPADEAIATLKARWPDRVSSTIRAADQICRHEFNLLGSGFEVIADPDRPSADGYTPIDWAVDPIAGLRFPQGFAHSTWNPQMRPGLADIKWPWEIGRCQHWVTLGQAYRLTGDERYAKEIIRQHADFQQVNPPGVGVQFVCTMDVAIRALNWAMAFELIRQSRSFDRQAMHDAYRSMFDVGHFIENNLENKYEVTSNHFLSNVVGLYGLGLVFRDLTAGARWLRQGRDWLEQEMKVQVLDDGADYESSVPYHRLVTELFLGGARIAQLEGRALSSQYLSRLRQMVDFHFGVIRPDGLMPQIGDADDGRLHIFADYGTWLPQDGRHLAGGAAAVFDDFSWMNQGGDIALWEAAWWNVDPGALPSTPAAPPSLDGRLFASAGMAVARSRSAYLLVTNARVGTNGFGNHKHNDLLSFEFHSQGTPLIVDPGSYVYTSDPDARNLFRGTAYHNTVALDEVEQNDIRLDYLFRMFETSTVTHVEFEDSAERAEYRGRHTGYERLPSPATHERHFVLDKVSGTLRITDVLSGDGSYAARWHFHVAPGVAVETAPGGLRLSHNRRQWQLMTPAGLEAAIHDAWYSPSYGVRVPCKAIDLSAAITLSSRAEFLFELRPTILG